MIAPPEIHDEAARMASLRSLDLLDTDAEPRFDELVELAAHVAHMPIATLSLIDTDRQWFKSVLGIDLVTTERVTSFCGHTIAQARTLVVPDTLNDERFVDNPFVVDQPRIRFYAGAPLIVDPGLRVGTLCVMDTRPRTLLSDDRRALEILARQAATHMRAGRMEQRIRQLEQSRP